MIGKVKLFGDSPLDPPRGKLEVCEVCEVFEVGSIFPLRALLLCALCAKLVRGLKGSIGSMSSKGWGFRKVSDAFPYFLFPCVFAPLRALRETC